MSALYVPWRKLVRRFLERNDVMITYMIDNASIDMEKQWRIVDF